jgi:hypothetical protein
MTNVGQAAPAVAATAAPGRLLRLLGIVAVVLALIVNPVADAQTPNAAAGLDPRAAKARLVLEPHCARCPPRDRLQRPAPERKSAE